MKKLLAQIIRFIFPDICIRCKKQGVNFCEICFSYVPQAVQPKDLFISALYSYKDKYIQHIIWQFKYQNVRHNADLFGEKLYENIIGDISENLSISKNETLLIVPVPLHKTKLHQRGYNQSELLARSIMRYDKENIFKLSISALVRTKATYTQTQSEGRSERFKNMYGAFYADKKIVSGKNIILIDDVTTTGATLSETHKTLSNAGAKSIRAYTIAH